VSDLLLLEIVGEVMSQGKEHGHRTVEGVQEALGHFPAAGEPETSRSPAGDVNQDRRGQNLRSRTYIIDRQGRVTRFSTAGRGHWVGLDLMEDAHGYDTDTHASEDDGRKHKVGQMKTYYHCIL
jgi:hypothetical protein